MSRVLIVDNHSSIKKWLTACLGDTHISMSLRDKQVKALREAKVNNLEQRKDNGFSFRVEPGEGAKVVPMFQVRI